MGSSFALQVTPELMQRLLGPERTKPKRRRQPKQEFEGEHRRQGEYASSGGWPTRETYFPPFGGPSAPFGGLFGGPTASETPAESASDIRKELGPVYQAIKESEQLSQTLRIQGDEELEKVQEMARDLQEKQYRAPSHAPPCTNERGNCVECYRENHKNPLLCSKLVQEFAACSRQAQENFAASVSS